MLAIRDPQKLVGETLHGTYRIDRLIGRGGMGYVFAGTHLRLQQRCAIKLLLTGPLDQDEETSARFQREARLTAGLRHPHIVEVIDFNVDEQWGPYLVLELLDGESLESRLSRSAPLALPLVSTILAESAAALAEAHQQGIVHRDLKPSNIFLCRSGERTDYVKVLDFGIAKVLGSQSLMTTGRARLGTTLYMSPEQASGAPVDWRTDQFAMGSIVYHLLTGRPPFMGDSDAAILYQIETKDPPPVATLAPALSTATVAVIARALAKSPEHRYSSILDFSAAFSAAQGAEIGAAAVGYSAESPPTKIRVAHDGAATCSTAEQTPRPSMAASQAPKADRRKTTWMTWGIVGLLVLLGGIGGIAWTLRARQVEQSTPPHADGLAHLTLAAADTRSHSAVSVPREAGAAGRDTTETRLGADPQPAAGLQPTDPLRLPLKRSSFSATKHPRDRKEACQHGDARACVSLGKAFERMKNMELAIAAYLQACNLKLARGCEHLGRLYGRRGDHAAAIYPYTEACTMRSPSACALLGDIFLQGLTGDRDVVRARKHYAQSCRFRSGVGCTKLGLLYCPGGALTENRETCQKQLALGCALGDQEGCRRIRQLKTRRRQQEDHQP